MIKAEMLWFYKGDENIDVYKVITGNKGNFKAREFRGRGRKIWPVGVWYAVKLQIMRNIAGRSMSLNSSYRGPIHNASIGGASRSRHMTGTAGDVKRLHGYDKWEMAHLAYLAGVCRIGVANNFTHIDSVQEHDTGEAYWLYTWLKHGTRKATPEEIKWIKEGK